MLSCAATVIAGGVLAVPLLADSLAGAGFVVAGSPPSDPRPVRLGAGMPDGYLVAGVAGANIYATTAGVFDRCLYAPDAERDYVCFDVPRAVDWVPVRTDNPTGPTVSAIMGVTDPAAAQVRVRIRGGNPVQVATMGAPTSGDVRFFVAELPRGSTLTGVQAFDAAGRALGASRAEPAVTPHRAGCDAQGQGTKPCYATPVPKP